MQQCLSECEIDHLQQWSATKWSSKHLRLCHSIHREQFHLSLNGLELFFIWWTFFWHVSYIGNGRNTCPIMGILTALRGISDWYNIQWQWGFWKNNSLSEILTPARNCPQSRLPQYVHWQVHYDILSFAIINSHIYIVSTVGRVSNLNKTNCCSNSTVMVIVMGMWGQ